MAINLIGSMTSFTSGFYTRCITTRTVFTGPTPTTLPSTHTFPQEATLKMEAVFSFKKTAT